MRRSLNSLAPLLGSLFACVFLFNLVSSLGAGQLAAYSETRSFRDALEGRSMEEAISGPVDKDTSSYGDRTSGGANDKQSATGQAAADSLGAGYGASQSDSASPNTGQMMINIPANGNLNPMTSSQQTDEQQQQQSSAGELEREAGPISADFPIDTQQQLMEQKMMMMMKAKQMSAGRSGRLTGSAPSSSMMMEMLRTMQEERRRKMMGQMGARSDRLQQEQQQEDEQRGDTKKSDAEQAADNNYGRSQTMAPSSNGYGKKMNAANGGPKAYDNKPTMQNGDGQQKQQQLMMTGGQDEASYEQQQQQQKPDEMRAKYTQMMNGDDDKEGSAYRKQQAGNMGQNMMMSLANKAAYMAGQRSPSAHQTGPMMMTPAMGPNGAADYGKPMPMSMAGRSGQSYDAQGQYGAGMQMQRADGYQPMRASGAMRAMRRANQRRPEKKISPAMMNAMLNKMLMGANEANGGQYQTNGMAQKEMGDSNYSGAGQQQQVSMSAAKMRAEMLAQMMMMTAMAGNGDGRSSAYGGSSMSNNNSNKRDSYKMMQQYMMMNRDEEQKMEMPMSQMGVGNYGDRSMPSSMPMAKSVPMNGGYGDQESVQSTTPSSYGSAATSSQSPMAAQGYEQQQMSTMGENNYDTQQHQQEVEPDTKGMGQKQQMMMMPVAKSYGMGANSPMMSSMRLVPTMAQAYGNNKAGDSGPSERPASNGKLMQQVMKVMRAKQLAMSQQGKSAYGAGDQQKQQMQTETKNYAGESQRMQPDTMSYGTNSDEGAKGAPSRTMNRPVMPVSMGMSYDGQQQQQTDDGHDQQQQVSGSAYEQTSDQYAGAAPIGQAEPFSFDYKVEDEATGNNQYRKEESDKNGVVRGSYGYMDTNSGVYRHVEYVADENGFRANIKSNEPGLSDKTTSKQTKPEQPQQQMKEAGQSGANDQAEAKGSSGGSYQSARGPAPPSSSSSLGGSAALQQMAAPMSKTTQQMEDQMPQQRPMQSTQMPLEQQQQQQATGAELEK